jgi:hypothetical protein
MISLSSFVHSGRKSTHFTNSSKLLICHEESDPRPKLFNTFKFEAIEVNEVNELIDVNLQSGIGLLDCMVYRRTMTILCGLDGGAPFPFKHTVNASDPRNIPPLKDFGVPDQAITPVPPMPPTIQEILDIVCPFAQRFRVRQPGEAPEEVENDESVTTLSEDDAMEVILGDQSVSNELIRIAQLVVRVGFDAYRDTKHALVAVCESFAAHPNRPAGQPDLNSPP